jgi:hypothetical protein
MKSVRLTKHYRQALTAEPERVFPLLCPEREKEWAVGWDAECIHSDSGLAEPNAIFATAGALAGGRRRIWVVTRHEPPRRVEFTVFEEPDLVTSISVALEPAGAGAARADITYTYTGLSEAGNAYVRNDAGARFDRMVVEWEAELNHFLRTGTKAPG